MEVAVIGPNAKVTTYCGGGSSSLSPYYAVTPFDGIKCKVQGGQIKYTVGYHSHKELPLLGHQLKTSDGKTGFSFRVYNEPPSAQERLVVDDLHLTSTDMMMFDYSCPRIKSQLWFADIEGYFSPEENGEYEFGLCVYGTGKLFINNELVIDNETQQVQGTAFLGQGTREERAVYKMEKGKSYCLKVEYASAAACKLHNEGAISSGGGCVRLGGVMNINPEEEIDRAVKLAAEVDQVVICAGLNVSEPRKLKM